jgi:GNAT superfamily N-acetyltransferase
MSDGRAILAVEPQSLLLDSVKALSDENKRTLGMLPYGAIDQCAENGTILACVDPEHPDVALAYAIFRLTREEVKLTQLAVASDQRRRGVARALVDELSTRYPAARGVKVKCRRDYDAARFWPRAGFVALGDVQGRAKDGHQLTVWWKDHGHSDLLSWNGPSAGLVSVAVDANVYFDLSGEAFRGHRGERVWPPDCAAQRIGRPS